MHAVEFFTEAVLSWIPFYYFGRLCMILFLGQLRGARLAYAAVLQPFLVQHEAAIDQNLSQGTVALQGLAQSAVKEALSNPTVQDGMVSALKGSLEHGADGSIAVQVEPV